MGYNTYPQNPFPSNSELLQKLDAVAKAIDDMPTFTSNDKSFLEELPAFPSSDGVKVLTATTESGETSLSYEEIENELPTEPTENGTKVLTATTESGETVLSWETQETGIVDYSTTEQKTGKKWIDGRDIYFITINFGALPNATSKTVNHNIANIDFILDRIGVAYTEDRTSMFVLPQLAIGASASSSVSLGASRDVIVITTGVDRTNITNCYVTLFYVKLESEE